MPALKAMRFPSGDQSKPPTENSLPLVSCLPVTGAFIASATSNVQRCECM